MSLAVSDRCPWSGKTVQSDSVTTYHGQVADFCDPGSRDEVETATNLGVVQSRVALIGFRGGVGLAARG